MGGMSYCQPPGHLKNECRMYRKNASIRLLLPIAAIAAACTPTPNRTIPEGLQEVQAVTVLQTPQPRPDALEWSQRRADQAGPLSGGAHWVWRMSYRRRHHWGAGRRAFAGWFQSRNCLHEPVA